MTMEDDVLDRLFDTYMGVYGQQCDDTMALHLGNKIARILIDHGRITPEWSPTDADWDWYDERTLSGAHSK